MLTCEQVMAEELTEKYLLNQLAEAERDAFEQHYFECERCHEEVQNYGALGAELGRQRQEILRETTPAHTFPRWVLAVAVAVVLLSIGLALWIGRPAPDTQSARPPAVAPVQSTASPETLSISLLTKLAQIDRPPRYAPIVLRGPDQTSPQFRQAMKHYSAGEYIAAAAGLRSAIKEEPSAPAPHFFLGICLLLSDQNDTAKVQLGKTVSLGQSQYLEAAHFYLAKAYLRTGDIQSAREELKKTIGFASTLQNEAQQLLDHLG